ncbi:LacI family transcriptional regulator/LacI family fructose operon transcriptional repressor [Diaminobutyricimonas aerilata]|uniref:LacI family transcriptional regulator/LacI family fructose operon transcriptional repressor n=1 Tax=Diaminobutyricimonas aerilata TaxID=1162967 RepID=A0A2M9CHD1_9MICO|nr:LacI family DNA-binding transcriptional regulator [Diaminobutyricimonas aerilata]PJJ71289.1 LacI family transcriptional regulator/LacI family fructose operon transcriptional repressor [Diaminobutyricimonas aerilata]
MGDATPTDAISLPPLRRATIKEVAEAAGVSRSTASRALAGNGYVAAHVRERVREAARELGYVVDATARSLKQQSSRLIGVLVSDLRNSFYADLAFGAGRAARRNGYTMMLIDDGGIPDDELEAAEAFVALRVAGVVGTPVSGHLADFLVRQRTPMVEVDRQFAEGRGDAVVVDNRAAARATTEHLLELGHRRIALFIDETDWTTGRDRHEGYADALRAAGIELDGTLVVPTGWDVDAAHSAAHQLLQTDRRPTAIFAANNVLAEGAWRAAADLGLAVPDDLSLVSFDDAPWMSMVSPGVTAVVQDAAALGEAAIETLLERIAEPGAAPRSVVLPAQIRHRGSTASPRA